MEEIKKVNDDNLDEVAGGRQTVGHYSPCFRCGSYDNSYYERCDYQWYGKTCCKDCFDTLNDAEKNGFYIPNQNE